MSSIIGQQYVWPLRTVLVAFRGLSIAKAILSKWSLEGPLLFFNC